MFAFLQMFLPSTRRGVILGSFLLQNKPFNKVQCNFEEVLESAIFFGHFENVVFFQLPGFTQCILQTFPKLYYDMINFSLTIFVKTFCQLTSFLYFFMMSVIHPIVTFNFCVWNVISENKFYLINLLFHLVRDFQKLYSNQSQVLLSQYVQFLLFHNPRPLGHMLDGEVHVY